MRGNRMRNPFEQVPDADRTGKRRADRLVSLGGEQNFTAGGFSLQPVRRC